MRRWHRTRRIPDVSKLFRDHGYPRQPAYSFMCLPDNSILPSNLVEAYRKTIEAELEKIEKYKEELATNFPEERQKKALMEGCTVSFHFEQAMGRYRLDYEAGDVDISAPEVANAPGAMDIVDAALRK